MDEVEVSKLRVEKSKTRLTNGAIFVCEVLVTHINESTVHRFGLPSERCMSKVVVVCVA